MSEVWGHYDTVVGGMVLSGMHAEIRDQRGPRACLARGLMGALQIRRRVAGRGFGQGDSQRVHVGTLVFCRRERDDGMGAV